MLASEFELLLQQALRTAQPAVFAQPIPTIFEQFNRAEVEYKKSGVPSPELHFTFEQIRLGVAIALLQIFTDLGGGEAGSNALIVLKKAARATSIAQIDAIIQKESKRFDQLFQNLYLNTEGELVLDLFARTLAADSRPEITRIVQETLRLWPKLDFPTEEETE